MSADQLTENDYLYIIRTLLPKTEDCGKMVRTLREDSDILNGMIEDPRLLKRILSSEEEIVKISPQLFFAVLISAVRKDLEDLPFTLERSSHDAVAVFDVERVKEFLDIPMIRSYLIDMLASFIKINSYTVPVRVRKGIWYRYRFNDFNIQNLMDYADSLEENRKFPALKRIADLCLFIIGFYSRSLPNTIYTRRRQLSKDEVIALGKTYYETASKHETANRLRLDDVMRDIGEQFELAVKPLSLIADNYFNI